MLLAIEILIGVLVVAILKHFWERRKLLQITSQFPGPKPIPFVGILATLPSDPKDIFLALNNFHKTYGKNVATWALGLDWRLAVTDPKDIETIMTTNKLTRKSVDYDFIVPWLGDGLLLSSGKKWFQRRKIITPTFHFNILQQFLETFDQQVGVMLDKLRKHENAGVFNMQPYITLCALDIINETAMGTQVNAQHDPDSKYVEAVHTASMIVFERTFTLSGQFPLLWRFTDLHRKEKRALKILHDFTDKIIRAKKLELGIADQNKKEEDDSFGIKKRTTFLELLLKSTIDGQPLTNEDIRDEVDTFMFEGHDTTTNGIGFTLYHLARHPAIQEQLYQEIVQVFGTDSSVPINYNSIQELKYMEMVIKESMRITPPVPGIARYLTEDTIIGGVNVPAGTNLNIPIYSVHHDKDNFPNPEVFDPERFSPENSEHRNPYTYIPFSAGSRNCIGQKFAMLEMKTLLSKLLMTYKWLPGNPEEKIQLRADVVLRPADGWNLKIVSR